MAMSVIPKRSPLSGSWADRPRAPGSTEPGLPSSRSARGRRPCGPPFSLGVRQDDTGCPAIADTPGSAVGRIHEVEIALTDLPERLRRDVAVEEQEVDEPAMPFVGEDARA